MVRTVSALWFSPVKSLHGVDLEEARIGIRGIIDDRMWMVVDANTKVFLTQRQIPRMALIHQSLDRGGLGLSASSRKLAVSSSASAEDHYEVGIGFKELKWYPAVDCGEDAADWLSEFLERAVRLVRFPGKGVRYAPRGTARIAWHDGYPFLIASKASLEERNRRGNAVPMSRFRPNITVAGTEAHEEDHWRKIKIGDVVFEGMTLCGRCAVVNTNQETGERDPSGSTSQNFRTLSHYRQLKTLLEGEAYQKYSFYEEDDPNKICFARNFNHRGTGTIWVGDNVEVLEWD